MQLVTFPTPETMGTGYTRIALTGVSETEVLNVYCQYNKQTPYFVDLYNAGNKVFDHANEVRAEERYRQSFTKINGLMWYIDLPADALISSVNVRLIDTADKSLVRLTIIESTND